MRSRGHCVSSVAVAPEGVQTLRTSRPCCAGRSAPSAARLAASQRVVAASSKPCESRRGVLFVNNLLVAAGTGAAQPSIPMRGLDLPRVAGISVTVGDPLDSINCADSVPRRPPPVGSCRAVVRRSADVDATAPGFTCCRRRDWARATTARIRRCSRAPLRARTGRVRRRRRHRGSPGRSRCRDHASSCLVRFRRHATTRHRIRRAPAAAARRAIASATSTGSRVAAEIRIVPRPPARRCISVAGDGSRVSRAAITASSTGRRRACAASTALAASPSQTITTWSWASSIPASRVRSPRGRTAATAHWPTRAPANSSRSTSLRAGGGVWCSIALAAGTGRSSVIWRRPARRTADGDRSGARDDFQPLEPGPVRRTAPSLFPIASLSRPRIPSHRIVA